MIRPSFLSSSIVYTIGGALPMLAGIILLPFYTNTLHAEVYTQLLFYISISLFCQMFFSWSTETVFGIEFSRLKTKPEARVFTGTVFELLLLMGFIWIVLFSIFGNFIFKALFNHNLNMQFWPWGFYAVITAMCNAVFKTSTTVLIYQQQAQRFLLLNGINFMLTVSIAIIGLYLYPNSLYGPLYARLFSGIVILGMAVLVFKTYAQFTLSIKKWIPLFKMCLPLVGIVFSGWIIGQVDRYFLLHHVSTAELNAYDLILKCFFGIEFLQNSLSAVIYPRVFELWSSSATASTTTDSNRYFNAFTALNILMLCVFNLAVPAFIKWLVKDPAYYISFNYLGLLSGTFAARSIIYFFQAGLLYSKQNRQLLRFHFSGIATELVLVYILIPLIGIFGAIVASLAVRFVQTFTMGLGASTAFVFKYNRFKILGLPAVFIAVNSICIIFFSKYTIAVYCIQLLGFSILIYRMYRNELQAVLKALLKL